MTIIKCKCGVEDEQYRTDKRCKNCRKSYLKDYNEKRKVNDPDYLRRKSQAKKEYLKNPENANKQKIASGLYKETNKELIRQKNNEYNNRPENKIRQKKYYAREDVRARYNEKYKEPKRNEDLATKRKTENYLTKRREYENERYHTEELYRVSKLLRGRINKALNRNGFPQNKHLEEIIGCSYDELLIHLKKSWEDKYPGEILIWTGWFVDVDHIIPLASAKNIEEFNKLNHFSNLQLLKAKENKSKGKKVLS